MFTSKSPRSSCSDPNIKCSEWFDLGSSASKGSGSLAHGVLQQFSATWHTSKSSRNLCMAVSRWTSCDTTAVSPKSSQHMITSVHGFKMFQAHLEVIIYRHLSSHTSIVKTNPWSPRMDACEKFNEHVATQKYVGPSAPHSFYLSPSIKGGDFIVQGWSQFNDPNVTPGAISP